MKNTLKKWIVAFALATPFGIAGASGHAAYEKADIDLGDQVSLQRGAQIFTNYCLSCHSASNMRFNRLRDIGLTEDQIKNNLMFTTDKVGDVMHSAMSPADAKKMVRSGTARFVADRPLARRGLPLRLHARLLQRPDTPDRLEQPGVRQSGYAARFVGTTRCPRRETGCKRQACFGEHGKPVLVWESAGKLTRMAKRRLRRYHRIR